MSTELEQRLRRLAADVDLDQGRAEQRARQARAARIADRRRVLVGAAAAAAVAAVIATTGVALRDRSGGDGDGDGDVVAGEGPPLQTTSAARDGIEVTVTAPSEAVAGTRLWFDVVVQNRGDAAVYWNAGGCAIPVQAVVGPSSSVTVVQTPSSEEEPRWDGDVGGLDAWLPEHNTLSTTLHHQPEDTTGRRLVGCTLNIDPQPLDPGDEVRHRGSVELRVPPGDLPDGGRYQLVVAFWAYPDADVVGDPSEPVEVQAPVRVTDDPARTAGLVDVVDAFAADPRLAGWVASTEVPGRPDLVQDFGTELSWWRGTWELWVDAHWDEDRLLRMRYDPVSDDVVDVRTVPDIQAPEDEPGRSPLPGEEEPDEIL